MKSHPEKAIQAVSMPGAGKRQGWLFAGPKGARMAGEEQLDPGKSAYLVGARDVLFVPLWINSPDPALWDKLVRMELEGLKIDAGAEAGSVLQIRVVAEEGARRQIAAAVLTPEALERLPRDAEWARYDLAARYLPLPRDGIVFFREGEDWTLAFSRGGALAYLHPLGKGPLDADVMQEAFCLLLRLREQGMTAPTQTVHLWDLDPAQDETARLLGQWFRVPVDRAAPPEPVPPPERTGPVSFDPPDAARWRRRRERRSTLIRVMASTAGFYGVIVLGGWFSLHQRESALRKREAALEVLLPDAARMQKIQSTWEDLRTAVDPECYPLELFHQCAVLLPSQGVRLTHFEVDGPRLVIRGEASTTAQAIQYRNALLNAVALAQYQWESPKPEILPDNRAKFQAVGTQRAAGVPVTMAP